MKVYLLLLVCLFLVCCGSSEQSTHTDTDTSNPDNSENTIGLEESLIDPVDDSTESPGIPDDCEITVFASSEDAANVAKNIFDNDLSTRWSADGDGQTLIRGSLSIYKH